MTRPFLDFYLKIGRAPTGQKSSLSSNHKRNRDTLYRKLGLHPGVLKYSNVLEIGPGSGENTIDLLSRGIASLKLVDGVEVVLNSIQKTLGPDSRVSYEVRDVSKSPEAGSFDLVICEGVIPNQIDPSGFLQNVASSLVTGGFLLITTMDEISVLSEILRRYLAHSLFAVDEMNLPSLVDFFREDFTSIPSMTRTYEDWVLDSIINPWAGKLFSIADACDAAPHFLQPISLTPNVCPDENWYKAGHSALKETADWIEKYRLNAHHLIDARVSEFQNASRSQNQNLSDECLQVTSLVKSYLAKEIDDPRDELGRILQSIISRCLQLDSKTVESLNAYVAWLASGKTNHLQAFRSFWGRGQQHILFQKL